MGGVHGRSDGCGQDQSAALDAALRTPASDGRGGGGHGSHLLPTRPRRRTRTTARTASERGERTSSSTSTSSSPSTAAATPMAGLSLTWSAQGGCSGG